MRSQLVFGTPTGGPNKVEESLTVEKRVRMVGERRTVEISRCEAVVMADLRATCHPGRGHGCVFLKLRLFGGMEG